MYAARWQPPQARSAGPVICDGTVPISRVDPAFRAFEAEMMPGSDRV